ncbi:hypothetical protein [Stenotrophomonas sp. BIIR7]|uniref:hypothetical protein n=1 Tax=Stenotrophomonas sp. BIIR7 TaxID=1904462 RepID=UPI00114CA5A9|nr:hypothetical protein [Stenotrophomonas sp. BIIR7]
MNELLRTDEWDAVLDRDEIKEYFQTHDVNETFYVSGGASQTLLTPLAYVSSKSIKNNVGDNVLDVMRDLIELGADVNAPVRKSDYFGDGFLDGDKELVDLANGADRIELLVKNGARAKESHILTLFRDGADGAFIAENYSDLIKPRHFFYLNNDDASAAIIDELALKGYDFNIQDVNGDTALSMVQDIGVVKRLVDAGASVRIPNNDGETFLDQCDAGFIERNTSAEGVKIMKELGVDLNSKDICGDNTALHIMMINGNKLDGIRNLLDAGADPTVRNADDKLPSQVGFTGADRHEAVLLLESAVTKRKLMEELGESQQQPIMRRKM